MKTEKGLNTSSFQCKGGQEEGEDSLSLKKDPWNVHCTQPVDAELAHRSGLPCYWSNISVASSPVPKSRLLHLVVSVGYDVFLPLSVLLCESVNSGSPDSPTHTEAKGSRVDIGVRDLSQSK